MIVTIIIHNNKEGWCVAAYEFSCQRHCMVLKYAPVSFLKDHTRKLEEKKSGILTYTTTTITTALKERKNYENKEQEVLSTS